MTTTQPGPLKLYRLISKVVVSFTTLNDQRDVIISPSDDVLLESDGHTVWLINSTGRHETILIGAACLIWEQTGLIEQVPYAYDPAKDDTKP